MSTVSHKGLTFKLLYSRLQIEKIILNLSKQINAYYQTLLDQQKSLDLVVVCTLKGAFMFYSDLVKSITHPHLNQFIRCTSYQGTNSTGELRFSDNIDPETYTGKNVLIVEDIHDTGYTLKKLLAKLGEFKPKTLDVAVLVVRPDKPIEIDIKFRGLQCSEFIVGYGLDYDQFGRHYPEIYQKIN